jgi:DNA-binding MarR family transcriptional regulator
MQSVRPPGVAAPVRNRNGRAADQDDTNGTAATSQSDIARRAGMSKRTVVRVVGKLTAAGLLIVVYRGIMRRGPSLYRVRALARDCA